MLLVVDAITWCWSVHNPTLWISLETPFSEKETPEREYLHVKCPGTHKYPSAHFDILITYTFIYIFIFFIPPRARFTLRTRSFWCLYLSSWWVSYKNPQNSFLRSKVHFLLSCGVCLKIPSNNLFYDALWEIKNWEVFLWASSKTLNTNNPFNLKPRLGGEKTINFILIDGWNHLSWYAVVLFPLLSQLATCNSFRIISQNKTESLCTSLLFFFVGGGKRKRRWWIHHYDSDYVNITITFMLITCGT